MFVFNSFAHPGMKLFSSVNGVNVRAFTCFDATSTSPTSNPSLSYRLITISPRFCLKRVNRLMLGV